MLPGSSVQLNLVIPINRAREDFTLAWTCEWHNGIQLWIAPVWLYDPVVTDWCFFGLVVKTMTCWLHLGYTQVIANYNLPSAVFAGDLHRSLLAYTYNFDYMLSTYVMHIKSTYVATVYAGSTWQATVHCMVYSYVLYLEIIPYFKSWCMESSIWSKLDS